MKSHHVSYTAFGEMIGDIFAEELESYAAEDAAEAADAMRGTMCADCGCEIYSVNGMRTECPCEAVASWRLMSEGYH